MRRTRLAIVVSILLCEALGFTLSARAQEPKKARTAAAQKIIKEGVQVEFDIAPAADKPQAGVLEDQDALVRFRITDANSKTPMAGVRPMVWLTQRATAATDAEACHSKIESYLGGSLRARPDVDLNSYYVLALNQEGRDVSSATTLNPARG